MIKKENKGFTLIELIVTVAIIAIFSGVVVTAVGTGANSYRNTSSSAKAQMETQDVMDQIQNMIIDVNRSVYYAYGKGINESIDREISNDIDYGSDSASKTFFACSATEKNAEMKEYSYSCDVIEWDSDAQKLYYACRVWDGVETEKSEENTPGTVNTQGISTLSEEGEDSVTESDFSTGIAVTSKRTGEISTKVEKTLLAENITDFRVDVSKAASKRIIRFQFTTNKNGKEITTIHTVNLRNQVQIQKPEEGYGTSSDGEKAGIIITHYPTEIKAGEALTGFDKILSGNIDPDSVQWVVESGDGTFKGSDGANLSLEAGENASGTIKIHVEARTTDGKTVVSSSVTINVIVKIPNELVTDTTRLVLAAGAEYTLSDKVKWRIEYNDGSIAEENVRATALIYDEKANSEIISAGMTLSADGKLNIPSTLGTNGSNGEFTFTVKYYDRKNDKYITGTFFLEIARLDISKPTGTLYVGDEMPFEYIYKEGGKVSESEQPQISYTTKPKATSTGRIGEKLTKGDAGVWEISAEIKLPDSTEKGYGTVRATTSFNVVDVEKQAIQISNGNVTDTIVAGQEYHCSYYNPAHFYFPMSLEGNWQYRIEWTISDSTDSDTKFMNTPEPEKAIVEGIHDGTNNDVDAILNIGNNEHGFVLSADMIVYEGNPKKEKYHYVGQLNVKVITNIKVVSPPKTVIKGNTYPLEAEIVVWKIDENGKHVSTPLANGADYIGWNASASSFDTTNKWWTIDQYQTDTTVQTYLTSGIPDVLNATSRNLMQERKITVQEAPYTLELRDADGNNSKEIFPDDELELVALATLNGEDYTPPYGMTLECRKKEDGSLVYPGYSNGTDTKHWKVNMSSVAPGDYEITVSYTLNNQKRTSNVYAVKIKRYTVTASVFAVNNKTTIVSGESTQIYLQLTNERGQTTGRVNWSPNDRAKTYSSASYQVMYQLMGLSRLPPITRSRRLSIHGLQPIHCKMEKQAQHRYRLQLRLNKYQNMVWVFSWCA